MADPTRNNPSQTPEQPVRLPDGLSRAALIRAAADGEGDAVGVLNSGRPGDASEAAADQESLHQALAFEQDLRKAVARSMTDLEPMPTALRQQVLDRLNREYEAHDERSGGVTSPPPALPMSLAESKRDALQPGSDARSRLSIFSRFAAIAAVLLLGTTVIFYGIQQMGGAADPSQQASIAAVSNQLQFVQREHDRCAESGSNAFASKIVATGIEESRIFAEQQLGCGGKRLAEAISRMQDVGYSFVGVGPCKVPGGGKSLHALFTPTESNASLQPVSVFLLENPGKECGKTKSGVCYSCPNATRQGKPAMLWRDNNLMVFVHSSSQQSVDYIRAAYHAPDSVQPL